MSTAAAIIRRIDFRLGGWVVPFAAAVTVLLGGGYEIEFGAGIVDDEMGERFQLGRIDYGKRGPLVVCLVDEGPNTAARWTVHAGNRRLAEGDARNIIHARREACRYIDSLNP